MNFAKQLNSTDCGPCALFNALKFLKFSGSYKRWHKTMKSFLGWEPNTGVPCSIMHSTLLMLSKSFNFECKKFSKPTWKKMRRALDDGYGLIAAYNFKPEDIASGHFVFLSKKGFDYICWNDSIGDVYSGDLQHLVTNANIWRARFGRGDIYVWKVRNE
jgi:hypothetical protein